MNNIDKALSSFEEFERNYELYRTTDLSESDTRSKFLDFLLINVLGWEEKDIVREGHNIEGYFDYKVSTPDFQFIIEAKKNLIDFQLPINHKSSKIKSLITQNKEVINQIRSYLVEEGLQCGVITNGKQFIIGNFVNIDGKDWKDNSCLIFNGVEEIKKRFIEFYNCISKIFIVENKSIPNYIAPNKAHFVIEHFKDKNEELIRNDLSSQIVPIIQLLFGDIATNDSDFDDKILLKECFIKTEETKKNKSEIDKIFDDAPPSTAIPIRNTENLQKQIKIDLDKEYSKFDLKPIDPIVLIGGTGAGKSTFINYLFKIDYTEDDEKTKPVVYLDFRKYNKADIIENNNVIYKEIIDNLIFKYNNLNLTDLHILQKIYKTDIELNDKGIWKYYKDNDDKLYNEKLSDFLIEQRANLPYHLEKLSRYLSQYCHRKLIIIFDNADQMDEEIQKTVFLFSQTLVRKLKCGIIISLREGYYYRFKNTTPFDAFRSNVYHITPPPYKEVLQKRIDFLLNHYDFDKYVTGGVGNLTVKLTKQKLKLFFSNIKYTLFDSGNEEILDFLYSTTFPNIRLGLLTFDKFLTSGHTNMAQYVLGQNYRIPIWEFVKSLGFENKLLYSSDYSVINNLFKPADGNKNLFIKIRILKFLLDACMNFERHTSDFYSTEKLITFFESYGFTKTSIINELKLLLKFKMLETSSISMDILPQMFDVESDNIRPTLKAHYYFNFLINRFQYLLLVLQDTPFYDSNIFNQIILQIPLEKGKQDLEKKRKSVYLFLKYLKVEEERERTTIFANTKSDALNFYITRYITQGIKEDSDRIKFAIEKHQPLSY